MKRIVILLLVLLAINFGDTGLIKVPSVIDSQTHNMTIDGLRDYLIESKLKRR